jgi:7,8-dihydroneopterin aldolase/epimerase/oxygenase
MYRIEISGIECQARIGVPDKERRQPQRLLIDLEVRRDLSEAVSRDDIQYTIDYERVVSIVQEIVQERPWSLIESLAASICRRVLAGTGAEEVRVKIVKFPLSLQGLIQHVAAEVSFRAVD